MRHRGTTDKQMTHQVTAGRGGGGVEKRKKSSHHEEECDGEARQKPVVVDACVLGGHSTVGWGVVFKAVASPCCVAVYAGGDFP